MPSRWKRPIDLLSRASGRSPWQTLISTEGWLSAAVEKVSDLRVGIVVLASMSLVITPPKVSIPSDSGVTSSSSTSFTSPVSTPPWIAAPTATTSSGFTLLLGVRPKNSSTIFWIAGIRVEPPTRITSLICEASRPASRKASLQGSMVLRIRWSHSCSNLARVSDITRCCGMPLTGMMYGRLISVEVEDESSIFAFSAASFRRCKAIGSWRRSIWCSALNASAM